MAIIVLLNRRDDLTFRPAIGSNRHITFQRKPALIAKKRYFLNVFYKVFWQGLVPLFKLQLVFNHELWWQHLTCSISRNHHGGVFVA